MTVLLQNPDVQEAIFADVLQERSRQEEKCAAKRAEGKRWRSCADVDLPAPAKLCVLAEEFGEVAREVTDAIGDGCEPGPNLRVELVQLLAVGLAWLEAIDA